MLSIDAFAAFLDSACALWPRLDVAVALPSGAWLRPDAQSTRWTRLGGLDKAALGRTAGELWSRALRGGAGIHWRPAADAAAAWRYALLDDLNEVTAQGVARRYRAVLIRTSPGSVQAVLPLARAVTPQEQYKLQSALVARLLASGRNADRGATGQGQFARMPGFPHPGHDRFVVELLQGGQTETLLDPDAILTDDVPPLPAAALCGEAVPVRAPRGPQAPRSGARGKGAGSVRPVVAQSASERDFKEACDSVRRGDDPAIAITAIAVDALARGKRRTEAEARAYAERTYAAALARVRAA